MTLAAAGEKLGMKGAAANRSRRLQRILLAKEKRIRKKIMLRSGGAGNGARYLVTIWLLRKHCPELFDRRDELAVMIRSNMEKIENEIDDLRSVVDHLGETMAEERRAASSHK